MINMRDFLLEGIKHKDFNFDEDYINSFTESIKDKIITPEFIIYKYFDILNLSLKLINKAKELQKEYDTLKESILI
jgi:hypothetical protein